MYGTSPARTRSLHLTCVALLQKLDQQLRKLRKEKDPSTGQSQPNHTFIPVAVETLGPMGPEAKSFLLDFGRRLRQHTGEPRSTSYLLPHTADLNGDPKGQHCCHDGITATREGTGRTAAIVILHVIVLSIVLYVFMFIFVIVIIIILNLSLYCIIIIVLFCSVLYFFNIVLCIVYYVPIIHFYVM